MKNLITQHSESKTEEAVALLWLILSVLLSMDGHPNLSLVCAAIGAVAMTVSFLTTLTEIRQDRAARKALREALKDDSTFAA